MVLFIFLFSLVHAQCLFLKYAYKKMLQLNYFPLKSSG